ncbi:aldo/keto reductase [Agromyces sp. CFH 90414]|uniref:Aldo/keto reductase n=1 Tax=Agromyces agglutinans TaxID=2662258 RepID=A0A6I2FD11_9MICO|nr:aldo/keto reductase [Agromyces agglutinans]MRG60376.1 aldo/keto reductase [Agromyces agglutinans]
MKTARLGTSGLEVSRLCLGTMNFGRHVDRDGAHAVLDAALAAGINYVDTANRYGTPARPHASEEIVGEWLAKGGRRRERIVLATKVYEATDDWPNHGGLSAINVRRAAEASLARLQTDRIDIYQMHHVDRTVGWDEIWEAFDLLRAQGRIVYTGSSNFAGWHLAMAQNAARRRGTRGLITEQSVYNLTQRSIELEVLSAARELGIGVVPWSPLAGGLLAGVSDSPEAGRRASAESTERMRRHDAAIAATRELASDLGVSEAVLSLAWLLAQPGIAAPVIGPRTPDQLESLLPAVELELGADVLARLDTIWPGPGEAPEAYAW